MGNLKLFRSFKKSRSCFWMAQSKFLIYLNMPKLLKIY